MVACKITLKTIKYSQYNVFVLELFICVVFAWLYSMWDMCGKVLTDPEVFVTLVSIT